MLQVGEDVSGRRNRTERKSVPGDLVVDDVGGKGTVVDEVSECRAVEGVALLKRSRDAVKQGEEAEGEGGTEEGESEKKGERADKNATNLDVVTSASCCSDGRVGSSPIGNDPPGEVELLLEQVVQDGGVFTSECAVDLVITAHDATGSRAMCSRVSTGLKEKRGEKNGRTGRPQRTPKCKARGK
jgi:hypothetical protein